MDPKKRIAIVGAYGVSNTGDEAILESLLNGLRAALPDAGITVIGLDSKSISRTYNVDGIEWDNWERIIDTVPDMDLMIVGGGGLFHDYWDMRPDEFLTPKSASPMYYVTHVVLSKLLGRPCMVAGVGIGPLRTEIGRSYVAYALNLADYGTLRDSGSLRVLEQTGCSNPNVKVTADPAFALPAPPVSRSVWEELIGSKPRGLVFGVCVRGWDRAADSDQWEEALASALDESLAKRDSTLVFIPFHVSSIHPLADDRSAARRIHRKMRNKERVHICEDYLPPQKADAVIAACDIMIGMRLHSTIMAIRNGVPVVALAYDPKVANAMEEAGLPDYCFNLAAFDRSGLTHAIDKALQHREQISTRLRAYSLAASRRAQQTIEIAVGLIESGQDARPLMDDRLRDGVVRTIKEHRWLSREIHQLAQMNQALSAEARNAQDNQRHLNKQLSRQADQAREREEELLGREKELLAREQELLEKVLSLEWEVGELRKKESELEKIKAYRWYPLMTRYGKVKQKVRQASRVVFKDRPAQNQSDIWPTSAARLLSSPPERAVAAGQVGDQITSRSVRAERAPSEHISIVAPAFFDMSGTVPYFGGAERYLMELVYLLRSMGYQPEVYQPGDADWVRYFRDVRIRGLDTGGSIDRMNEVFHSRIPRGALTIYLAFHLADTRCFQPSIGISHGVYWDSEFYQQSPHQHQEMTQRITRAFSNLTSVVSVDTNTINWLRTVAWPLSEKFHYIPNFVDLSQFAPRPAGFKREAGKLVILFPRRLYHPRGFWLVAEVLPAILERVPDVVFYFVGQADSEREREFVEGAMRTYPGRVRWDVFRPERMHEAYWAADISIIPTVFAEGTSLSCIEAMACGNAVIATDVGGLPNVVLHRHNGLLIRPQAEDLLQSLELLIEDEVLRHGLAQRAVETARAFSLAEWRAQWRKVLQGFLPQLPPRAVRRVQRPPRTLVIENPSLPWGQMKQRPHYIAEQVARAGWEVFWRKAVEEAEPAVQNLNFIPQDVPGHGSGQFVYIFYPYDYEYIKNYADPIVIYDVLDDISIHDRSDEMFEVHHGKRARDYHEKLLGRADILMTSSAWLHERLINVRPDAILIPNGVDLSRFAPETIAGQSVPEDIARIPGPRIGFHGALAEWLDVRLINHLARSCPRYQFVFVGPISFEGFHELARLENCHLLGEKAPETIPQYISAMDVSILPFSINPLTRGVRPLKVLESLAMRRPVVATPLPEIEAWPYVFQAADPGSFRDGIEQALSVSGRMRQAVDLTRFLVANSWQSNVRRLLLRMNRLLLKRGNSLR